MKILVKNLIVSASILSCDFANLEKEIKNVENSGADWIHLDVMDGHFVPNITFGLPIIRAVRKITNLFLDLHFMISDPSKLINEFIETGINSITFPFEITYQNINLDKLMNFTKSKNVKTAISINPETSINNIINYLEKVDMVLVMTVNPGFGEQKMILECLEKVKFLKNIKSHSNLNFLIQVDGGVNNNTINLVKLAGADVVVSGSYIFKSKNYKDAINNLKLS